MTSTPDMPPTSTGHPRAGRRSRRLAVLAAGAVVALVAAGITLLLIRISAPSGTPSTAAAVPPSNEVEIVHTAVHDIDDRCRTRSQSATPAALQDDADRIVTFARRYPDASFAIDDENGTTLALLLVARQALGPCAPAAASSVNEALPAQYRDSPASTSRTGP